MSGLELVALSEVSGHRREVVRPTPLAFPRAPGINQIKINRNTNLGSRVDITLGRDLVRISVLSPTQASFKCSLGRCKVTTPSFNKVLNHFTDIPDSCEFL